MKKVFGLFCVLVIASYVNAGLLVNEFLIDGSDSDTKPDYWSCNNWGAWYCYAVYHEGVNDNGVANSDFVVTAPYWGNAGIWQETAADITFQANTVYALTLTGRDGANCTDYVVLQIGPSWSEYVYENFEWISKGGPTDGSYEGQWETKILTIDTTDHPTWVGQTIKVAVKANQADATYPGGTNQWGGRWGSITLEIIPEPATIIMIGIGTLLGLRRQNA